MPRSTIYHCADLAEFIHAHRCGHFDEHPYAEEEPGWDDTDCLGDGWDPNPLLAAPGDFRGQGPVAMSGEIRDGKGFHPMATMSHGTL